MASLESLTPRDAESKIEEKIEGLLLKPEVKALSFQIKIPPGNPGKKVVPNVNLVLQM